MECPLRQQAMHIAQLLPANRRDAMEVMAHVRELIAWADGAALPADKPRSNIARLVGDEPA